MAQVAPELVADGVTRLAHLDLDDLPPLGVVRLHGGTTARRHLCHTICGAAPSLPILIYITDYNRFKSNVNTNANAIVLST